MDVMYSKRNVIFTSMCMMLCQNHPELEFINHKFFKTRHAEMEYDSICSEIEKKSKNVSVYIPEEWAQIIKTYKNNRPFFVSEEFLDFKADSKVIQNIPIRSIH